MIINPDLNILFIHLQKTGGSFVEKFLEDFKGTEKISPKHIGIHAFMQNVKEERISKLIKFGCVRNPYSWYVSWWTANSREGAGSLFPKIFTGKKRTDFKEFMKYIMNEDFGNQHDLNGHQIQCLDIGVYTYRYKKAFFSPVFTSYDSMVMDKILFTESLNKDLADLLNLKGELLDNLNTMPKIHVSCHQDYRTYYDDELIELIKHKDNLILQEYNYEF